MCDRGHHTAIECTPAQEDSVAAYLVLERALRLSLRVLRFLEASRGPLNSINRPVNKEKHTHALGEELTALQGSVFRFILFLLFYYYDDV